MPQKPRSSRLIRTSGPTQALRKSEQRFRLTFEMAGVGIAHISPDGRFLLANKKLCGILGYNPDEFTQLNTHEVTHPEDLAANILQTNRMLSGKIDSYILEKRCIHKEGQFVWVRLTSTLVRGNEHEPRYFIAIIEDISDRKQKEGQLAQTRARLEASNIKLTSLSRTDALTGCMSRHVIIEELHKTWLYNQRYSRNCTLAFIDIDAFKSINNQYGHTIGDRALCRLSHHIKSSLRDTDCIGRYAGDEFLVLLQEIDLHQAEKIMAGIRHRPTYIETYNRQTFKLEFSYGLANIHEPTINNIEQWTRLADERMFHAKNTHQH